MTPGPNVGGGVAPGPPAGGVRNHRGNSAQARGPMTKQALRKNRPPSGGVKPGPGPQGQFGGGKKTPLQKQQEREKARKEREAKRRANQNNNQNNNQPSSTQPPVDPAAPPPAPNPYIQGGKPDPRDGAYWDNVAAITAMADVELAGLQLQGDRAETAFNEEGMVQAEYNRQRKRNMGESRLGSGSAYSGSARRDQLENDTDYMISEGRRFRHKADADLERETERGRIIGRRDKEIRDLEIQTANSLSDDIVDESLNSAGDAGMPEPDEPTATPNKPTPGANNQKRLQNKIANQTERIKKMREQLAKTKDPKRREQLQKQIRVLQKKRTHAKGKVR